MNSANPASAHYSLFIETLFIAGKSKPSPHMSIVYVKPK